MERCILIAHPILSFVCSSNLMSINDVRFGHGVIYADASNFHDSYSMPLYARLPQMFIPKYFETRFEKIVPFYNEIKWSPYFLKLHTLLFETGSAVLSSLALNLWPQVVLLYWPP